MPYFNNLLDWNFHIKEIKPFNGNLVVLGNVEIDGRIKGDNLSVGTDLVYTNGTNFGIGTTTPSRKLEVNGTIRVTPSGNHPSSNGLDIYNPNNSTGQDAIIALRVAGASAGNPFISFDIPGETGWSIGIDNTDSNFKISNRPNSLTTGTKLEINTLGLTTVAGKIIAETNVLIGGDHKNYGTNGAFFAHKDRYDNYNHAHALYTSIYGTTTVNSSGDGIVAITHENVYNHWFHANGNVSFGAKDDSERLTVNGAVKHNGVVLNEITVTTSTEQITSLKIDQVIKIVCAVNFFNGDANGWVTFLSYDNFAVGGSYLIQIETNDHYAGSNGPWHYNYTYTGVMSWIVINRTNDDDSSQEISLHGYGHARADESIPAIKLRTLSRVGQVTPELQIADQQGDKPDDIFYFTFRMRKML